MFRSRAKQISVVVALIVVVISGVLFWHLQRATAGVPGSVVINEIMYNPSSGNQDDEFLELYNTTGSPIDLTGWCFSQGIILVTAYSSPACFNTGTTIAAHDYLIVSPSSSRSQTTYGVTPAAVYPGTNLSNGGEIITLVDDSAVIIDSVEYDDAAPWPTSPDGSGPSLELKNPSLDNADGANWGASVGAPTPEAENSIVNLVLPEISNVSEPGGVNPDEAVTVTANVEDADTVNLVYKLNFDSNQTIQMLDDGNSGDGAASDGIYGAEIPGQAITTLVRFKIEADNSNGTSSKPGVDDSINYYGYAVVDNALSTNAEVLNWFISDADYEDMHTNHVEDNVYVPCVVVYNGKVYDNSAVRIKGEVTRSFPKKSYKFKLPSGYKIDMAGGSNLQISEFHLNADYESASQAAYATAWWIIGQTGLPTTDYIATRIQKNGAFEGLYHFTDKYETEWRQANGYDSGELYDERTQVHSGANNLTRIAQWEQDMRVDNEDPLKRGYMLDTLDIPNIITFASSDGLLAAWDHYLDTNTMSYYNTQTGRWSHLAWDLDSAWDLAYDAWPTYITPYDHQDNQPMGFKRPITTSMYYQKDFRAMYLRRIKTLVDKLHNTDDIYDYFTAYADLHAADAALDNMKWSGSRTTRVEEEQRIQYVATRFKTYLSQDYILPPQQQPSDEDQIYINQAIASLSNDQEYIRLGNNSGQYVDISGWTLDEISYTIPSGTVVPPGGAVYLVRSDQGYKAAHTPVFIAGQFSNDLDDNSSQALTLRTSEGTEIDSYAY